MRAWLSILLALPVALVTTFVWMVAADIDSAPVAVLGIAGSVLISWLLLRGVERPGRPVPAADAFHAPPGEGQPGRSPRTWPGRIAHVLYAWNLAQFLGADVIFLDGDISARGAVWLLIATATGAHLVQAVFLRSLARGR